MAWNSRASLKRLFTKGETHEEVQASMSAVAAAIASNPAFGSFSRTLIDKMNHIPQGDEVFGPVDYANRLLDAVYDFADANRIWID